MHLSDRLDGWVRRIVILLIALVPFFCVPLPWIVVAQAKVLLVASGIVIAALLWLIARFLDRALRLPAAGALLAAFAVPVCYAVSLACTGFQSLSLWGNGAQTDTLAMTVLGLSLFLLTALAFAMHPGKVLSALRAFLFGSLVLFSAEVVHFVFPSAVFGGTLAGQTGNLFGTWHEFGMFAALAVFFALALLRTPVSVGLWRIVSWAVAVLGTVFLILAHHFDVLVLLAAMALVVICLRLVRARATDEPRWRENTLLGALAGGALFIAVFGVFISNVLPQQLRVAESEARPSYLGTFAIGQQSLAHPVALLFGVGPNTFTRQWGMYKPVDVNQTVFWNIDFPTGAAPVATAFITVGLAGLFAWLAFMLATVASAVRLWFSQTETPAVPIALPLSVGVVYLFVLQLISLPAVSITLLMYLLAGLLIALLAPTFVSTRTVLLGKGLHSHLLFGGALLATVAVIVVGVGIIRVGASEAYVNRGVVSFNATGTVDEASTYLQTALQIYSHNDRAHRASVQLGLISLQQLIASGNENEATREQLQSTLEETIQHGLAAVAIDGNSYQNWLLLASLYAQLAGSDVDGAYDNARAAFEKALEENPTSPIPYLNVAQLELLQKHEDLALQLLTKAVQLKSDYAPAYYLASQIYAARGDFETAFGAAANAAQYASSDSEAWYNLGIIAYSAKRYADADTALGQALLLQPQYANAKFVRALARYQLQDVSGALELLRELQKSDPGQALVSEFITDLENGAPLTPEQLEGRSKIPPPAAGTR